MKTKSNSLLTKQNIKNHPMIPRLLKNMLNYSLLLKILRTRGGVFLKKDRLTKKPTTGVQIDTEWGPRQIGELQHISKSLEEVRGKMGKDADTTEELLMQLQRQGKVAWACKLS